MNYRTKSGIIIPEKKDLEPIDLDGKGGEVYRFEDYAVKFIKISKSICDYHMPHEKAIYFLKKLRYELLLSPKDIIYDENEDYVGYLTDYIEDLGIKSLSVDEFLSGAESLHGAYDYLSKNGIAPVDNHGKNIVVNGKIYILDFDQYNIGMGNKKQLKLQNQYEYLNFICSIVASSIFEEDVYDPKEPVGEFGTYEKYFWEWISDETGRPMPKDAISFFEKDMKGHNNMSEYCLERHNDIVKRYSRK